MEFTGERYIPSLQGQIKYEHIHRYALCLQFIINKSVLDLASGEGYGAAILSKVAQSVVGVDIDATSIEYANRQYSDHKNLKFLTGSCDLVPIPDSSVDIVTSFETIEHHDKHEEMMLEVKRVLKQNGTLIISSPNRLVYSDEANYSNPYHVKELYYDELVTLLNRHFGYVNIYGQSIASASFVFPLSNSCETSMKSYTSDANILAQKVCSLESPTYYIAVCSDIESNVTLAIDSLFIEPYDHLLKVLQSNCQAYLEQLQQTQSQLQQTQSELNQSQSQLQQMQSELNQSQSQLQQMQSELQQAQSELHQSQSELHQSQSELHQAQSELQQVNQKIDAMRTSKFWRLRTIWFQIKRSLRLPIDG